MQPAVDRPPVLPQNAISPIIRRPDAHTCDSARRESAAQFCRAFDELRPNLWARHRRGAHIPLPEQPRLFVARWGSLITELSTS